MRGYIYQSFPINKNWDIEPIAVINKGISANMLYDLSATISFQKQLWVSILARNTGVIGTGVGFQYKRLLVHYTMEFATSGIENVSTGTHDFTVGILLGKNNKRLKDPIFLKHLGGVEPYQKW